MEATLPAFCGAARKLGVSPDGVALFSAEGKALATDRDILTLRAGLDSADATCVVDPRTI